MRAQLMLSLIAFLKGLPDCSGWGIMEKGDNCPYCKGTGQIPLKSDPKRKSTMLDRNGKPMQVARYYTCFCVNNRIISKAYNQLSGIPDISPKQALEAGKFAGFHNLLIFGNDTKFFHLVKATFILHANYHRSFEILNGYDVIKKYYVEQANGVHRSLEDLENRDLLVFIFDATMENKAQNKVVFEVIKRRIRMNNPEDMAAGRKITHPTWIYAPSQENFKDSKEYSEEIEELLIDFEKRDLKKYKVPFSVREKAAKKKGISTNLNLGSS